jgi:DNA-binding GntR family transcriptional regulator
MAASAPRNIIWPVDSKSASVLGALRSEIISGVLPGGTRLKEDVLAARFDVSRVPDVAA